MAPNSTSTENGLTGQELTTITLKGTLDLETFNPKYEKYLARFPTDHKILIKMPGFLSEGSIPLPEISEKYKVAESLHLEEIMQWLKEKGIDASEEKKLSVVKGSILFPVVVYPNEDPNTERYKFLLKTHVAITFLDDFFDEGRDSPLAKGENREKLREILHTSLEEYEETGGIGGDSYCDLQELLLLDESVLSMIKLVQDALSEFPNSGLPEQCIDIVYGILKRVLLRYTWIEDTHFLDNKHPDWVMQAYFVEEFGYNFCFEGYCAYEGFKLKKKFLESPAKVLLEQAAYRIPTHYNTILGLKKDLNEGEIGRNMITWKIKFTDKSLQEIVNEEIQALRETLEVYTDTRKYLRATFQEDETAIHYLNLMDNTIAGLLLHTWKNEKYGSSQLELENASV